MDSSTLLDYALFQLTPTRTRCDLVLFSGKKSEKIASGLLEPFLSHLKSAKDQISRGGYSIMLKPTSMDTSPWFTKAILERFVRFVSTPEVLERVVTIEREINQIENSNEQVNGVQASTSASDRDFRFPADPFKSKSETDGNDNAEAEENPKIRLQRVLESRKAMLKKEQAMAYARALVAGFEMDYIYDLVSFSDAFGALRLREACINFMEVCNKKNNDTIWLDEVAAMQTIFTGENNDLYQTGPAKSSASDSGEGTEFNLQHTDRVAQSPTWQNNPPQYMQSSQGPMFQRHQSYPGYIFPGPPPHYPGPWPVNFHDSDMYLDRDIKDSRRYRSSNKKSLARRHSRNDEGEEIDRSSSGSDSSEELDHEEASLSPSKPIHSKKNHRKSSRKVVIRNINYIASATNDDSGGDSDSKIKARYDSKKSINKSKVSEEESKGGNWDIFQNILMKDSDSSDKVTDSTNIQFQEEYSTGKENSDKKLDKPKHASDDFLPIGTPARNGTQRSNVDFEDEVLHRAVQTKDGDLLMPSREGGYNSQSARFGTELSIIKTSKEEDWIKTEISSNAGGSKHHNILHGEEISTNRFWDGENKRRVLLDDSFMIQSRLSDGTLQSQPKADIFMASDIVGANQSENSTHGKVEPRRFSEPEDLSMMLGQNSAALEMDYRNDISLYESVVNQSKTEPGDTIDATLPQNGKSSNIKSRNKLGRKVAGKEPKSKAPIGSLLRSKSDVPLRSKISISGSTRGKAEKEEEKRKRMEELAIQRQKRIAERSAAKGTAQEISKVHTKERKKKSPSTTEKSNPTVDKKTSHKPVMMSSTIDRLATARTTNKKPSTEPKVGQNRKPTSKASSSTAPSLIKKTKDIHEQKDKIDKKTGSNNSRSTSNDLGRDRKIATPVVSEDSIRTERTQTETKDGNKDLGMDTALRTVTSVEKRESTTVSTKDAPEEKNYIRILPDKDMLPLEDSSMPKEKQLNVAPEIAEHDPTAESNLKSAPSNEKVAEKKKLSFSPEISVMNISTPPSDSEASTELMQPRKKWNNGESSPKIPKGFRKLIFFGRRS